MTDHDTAAATPGGQPPTESDRSTRGIASDIPPGCGPQGGDDAAQGQETGHSDHEAAKYRHRLRVAEGERDDLAARLDAVQRSQVDDLATGLAIKPAALWASGVTLPDLCGEDGNVDPSRVRDAVEAARRKFGISDPRSAKIFKRGFRSQFLPEDAPLPRSWRSAFAPTDAE